MPVVCQIPCPAKVWKTLENMFSAVSETRIDSKLTLLQVIKIKKRGKGARYFSRIIKLVGNFEYSGHLVCKEMKKRYFFGVFQEILK